MLIAKCQLVGMNDRFRASNGLRNRSVGQSSHDGHLSISRSSPVGQSVMEHLSPSAANPDDYMAEKHVLDLRRI